jgi:hypothetical protein
VPETLVQFFVGNAHAYLHPPVTKYMSRGTQNVTKRHRLDVHWGDLTLKDRAAVARLVDKVPLAGGSPGRNRASTALSEATQKPSAGRPSYGHSIGSTSGLDRGRVSVWNYA